MTQRLFNPRERVLAAILLTVAAVARLHSEYSLYAVVQPLDASERTPRPATVNPPLHSPTLERPKEQPRFEDIARFEPDLAGKLYYGMPQFDAFRALKRAGYGAGAGSFAPGRRSVTFFERDQVPKRYLTIVCGRDRSQTIVHGYELHLMEWKGYVAGYTHSADSRFLD
jgi:hypothetical protein